MKLFIDFETRSELDVREVSPDLYSRNESTAIICLGWAVDEGPVSTWAPGEDLPGPLCGAIRSGAMVEALNAAFEFAIWSRLAVSHGFPRIPEKAWRCVSARAALLGLPGSLEKLASFFGLEGKDAGGRSAMLKLCKAEAPKAGATLFDLPEPGADPALLAEVRVYCAKDVELLRGISRRVPEFPDRELEIWRLDQKINRRGIQVDRRLCASALAIFEAELERCSAELSGITGGKVKSPTEIEALRTFANEHGAKLKTLDSEAVEEALKSDLSGPARAVLEIRKKASSSSVRKFSAMLTRSAFDGRIRDNLRYYGGFTGRWAGAGVQIQNFPRGSIRDVDSLVASVLANRLDPLFWGDPIEALVSALRPALIAGDGPEPRTLLIWDYAQIEARVLAWLACCWSLLDVFRDRGDPYKAFAATAFGVPQERVDKKKRFVGKTCILGLGYGMGAAALANTFAGYGSELPAPFCDRLVRVYRETYPEIPRLWSALESAAVEAVEKPGSLIRLSRFDRAGFDRAGFDRARVGFIKRGDFLEALLPSGRSIFYILPKLERGRIRYQKNYGGKLIAAETYGGKLAENVVQAIARDVMAEGILKLDRAGFDLVGTVHDEILSEAAKRNAEEKLEEGSRLLSLSPEWCASLPLMVEGFISDRYRKG